MFRVLGHLELDFPGSSVHIGAHKQRALLAMLLLRAGRPVSTDQLITELWPQAVPPTAGASLRTYVYRLRRHLRPLAGTGLRLSTCGFGYRLCLPSGLLDAAEFERLLGQGSLALERGEHCRASERLGAALALWRGAMLPDMDIDLVRGERDRLHETMLCARELWLEAELGCGRHRQVVADLERLVSEHPFREALWSLLITALARSGRRADALSAWTRVRSLLAVELGTGPAPELVLLQRSILRGEPV
ncbi:BTAD domain-containing putative transcriptional regulator [Nonomuraea sp. NPDC050310]|uniref:AfsR/SARP family transcriptional regulator n=1 Tax=unclassified Nonomuraea TaxID=2593643 RepID=UPI0033DA1087